MITEIHVTCKDIEEAKKISDTLLEKKLIACANMFPVKSRYRWKDKITDDDEIFLILKTNKKNTDKAIEIIEKVHSYELPAITIHDISCTEKTKYWIGSETI